MQKVAVYNLLSQRIQEMHNLPPYKSQVTIKFLTALHSTLIFTVYLNQESLSTMNSLLFRTLSP